MLIGGDDISNDVITLGTFFNVCFHSRSFSLRAIGGNLTAQTTVIHRGTEGGIQIPET